MDDAQVKFSEEESFRIPTFYSGMYFESIVCNGTRSQIIVIGPNNTRVIIEPDLRNSNGNILVIKRSSNGKREAVTANGVEEIKCKSKRYEFPGKLVEKGCFYSEELDLVFATVDVGQTIDHPYCKKNYNEMMAKAVESVSTKDSTHIVFAVNDPLARINELFACVHGHCFKIPCTHIRNRGGISLSIYLSTGSAVTTQETVDIEDIITNGVFSSNIFDKMFSFGLTANEALSQYDIVKKQFATDIDDIVNKRVIEQRKLHDKNAVAEKEKHDLEKKENQRKYDSLDHKYKILDDANAELKRELDAKSNLISEWHHQRDFISTEHRRGLMDKTIESKYDEQKHKTVRARWAESGETAKIVANVAAIVIGTIIVSAVKAYTSGKKGKD